MKKNKAQVWVETVIYVLIGLALIAIVLSMAIPQIEKVKDKGIIEQTVTAMETLNNKIIEIEQAEGNTRVVSFKIAKGNLEIDGENNLIKYVMEDTKLKLSEENTETKQGNIILRTEKKGSKFIISLIMEYKNLDIEYDGGDINKILSAASTPYKIIIENNRLRCGISDEEIVTIIKAEKPKIIGLGCIYSRHYIDVVSVARLIKRTNPSIKVILGGNHATTFAGMILKEPAVDFVVRGEGEVTFFELCNEIIIAYVKSAKLPSKIQ